MQDYFIYNGVNSTTLGVFVKDYSISLIQGNKLTYTNIPGSHGFLMGGTPHLLDKFLRIEVAVIGESPEDLQLKLSHLTKAVQLPGYLIMWDKPDFKYLAAIESTGEVTLEDFWAELTLIFRVAPIKVGATTTIPSSASPISVNNTGTAPTRGVITVTIPSAQTYLRVTHVESGKIIYIEDTLVANDVITIDFVTRKVRRNGVLIMNKVYFSSDYFEFPVGVSSVAFSAGTATVVFETRWL